MRIQLRAALCVAYLDVDTHCQAAVGAFRAKALCNSACCLRFTMPSCLTVRLPCRVLYPWLLLQHHKSRESHALVERPIEKLPSA